jgi:D-glycero-D-manno-heptose 1,7-bisphosphate phosphatase
MAFNSFSSFDKYLRHEVGVNKVNRAVFLDRDGVINKLVLNPKTSAYEAPQNKEDLELFDWTLETLKALLQNNYKLFIVSNQPDHAKGKTTLENIKAIHDKLHKCFIDNEINFTEYYYCYHHPDGVVKEYTGKCKCRKPEPYFVLKAIEEFQIDKNKSWFVGDRNSDITCGQSSGLKTIFIKNEHSKSVSFKKEPDFVSSNLMEAVNIIIKN